MITLSLAPSGALQAFCEPLGPEDPGYFIPWPEGASAEDQHRLMLQALLRRSAKRATAQGAPAPDFSEVCRWLEAHPPLAKAPRASAPLMTLETLIGLKLPLPG